MVRGNPAALLWINHNVKKIWKKMYCSKEGKYKKAHKEASVAYCKNHARRKKRLAWAVLQIMPFFCLRLWGVIEGNDILMF